MDKSENIKDLWASLADAITTHYGVRSDTDDRLHKVVECMRRIEDHSIDVQDYLLVVSFLEGQQRYGTAWHVLEDAEKYAEKNYEYHIVMPHRKLALLTALGRYEEASEIHEQIMSRVSNGNPALNQG